jgi:hypothetical protein
MEIEYRKGTIHQTIDGMDVETEVLLPDFGGDCEDKPTGLWGRMRLRYLREHRRSLYNALLLEGKLHNHLADTDEQAERMLSELVKQMAERQGITEALKATDQMLWVQRMNNIRNAAQEVVLNDLIYE